MVVIITHWVIHFGVHHPPCYVCAYTVCNLCFLVRDVCFFFSVLLTIANGKEKSKKHIK